VGGTNVFGEEFSATIEGGAAVEEATVDEEEAAIFVLVLDASLVRVE